MTSLSRAIRSQSQEKTTPDLLTPSTTFYDVSVSCNIFSKAEMRQFGASGNHRIKDCR